MEDYIENCSVFSEFETDFRREWFYFVRDSVRHHIDTYYYTVKIKGDVNDTNDAGMLALLSELDELKQKKKASYAEQIDFCGLSLEAISFATYEYCLRLNETFDIFVSSYLPTKDTPRFCVQLRTRSLILDGVFGAIDKSFFALRRICDEYGLKIGEVKENRVDYAFHTNIIQNPLLYFSDDRLLKTVKSSLRKYMKVGSVGEDMTLETISLGMRKSNNIFFRCYDKTREVIEKNYKAFFLDRWLESGLISKYDYYVYETAYKLKAYRTGVLVGRINWYLEFGSNQKLKDELLNLRKSCYEDADNARQIEKKLRKVLPGVTRIMNIEYQTKRRFYVSFDDQIDACSVKSGCDPLLARLYKVVYMRKPILDFLTSGRGVSFVKDRKAKKTVYCAFWLRIRSCKIDDDETEEKSLLRVYERHLDMEKTRNRVLSAIAGLAIIKTGDLDSTDFENDVASALAYMNDNDFYGFAPDPKTGKSIVFKSKDYRAIKKRKARQSRGIVEKTNEKKLEDEKILKKSELFLGKR